MYDFYDKTNPKSIEQYAKKLIGKTFNDVLSRYEHNDGSLVVKESTPEYLGQTYGNTARKGGLGNLIEEKYFGYKSNSNPHADFEEAGVELKVTPYEVQHDKKANQDKYVAGERLVLTMISFDKPVIFDFYKSHVWEKSKNILLIYYHRDKNIVNNLDFQIKFVELFTPPRIDQIIIQQDYESIINKIANGKAHELSEGDTMYLGACTKGQTAETSLVPQYYNRTVLAKRRAFCYKISYMTFVLNQYIIGKKSDTESLIENESDLENGLSFEEVICSRINKHAGKTDKALCNEFNIEYDNGKAQWITLAYKMLGIKSGRAEEFIKSNISIKAIRLEEDGHMIESSPLPPIKFKELAQETWEDSVLFNYFESTKFLFVVFKKKNDCYELKGCQLWNMSYDDLNTEVYDGWSKIKKIISVGVQFKLKTDKRGNTVVENNLPSKNDNRIIHMRPHAQQAYYKLANGFTKGKVSDGDELPDGQYMTKQSFWINNSYIISILREELK